jgi:two-component system, chemotaxis family, protein-glutamate methylesterase/glutaminase
VSGPARLRILVAQGALDTRLSDAIETDPQTEVAGVVTDGRRAVEMTERLRPDAVVMAAQLRGIDGFEAARRIMSATPTPIVMAVEEGEFERAGGEALRAGALVAVVMPVRAGTSQFNARRDELIAAVRTMSQVKLVRRTAERGTARKPSVAQRDKGQAVSIVALAASTGGPAALHHIFRDLPAGFRAPILVTQHIAPGFTTGMVRWLDTAGAVNVRLAAGGETLRTGVAYVAPDDRHLTLAADRTIALSSAASVEGHRPSASEMFRSVGETFGSKALGVILTGMGRDGTAGLAALRRCGGTVWAQDEPSSTVFGMPKSAIDAGVADRVLSLDSIGPSLAQATEPA